MRKSLCFVLVLGWCLNLNGTGAVADSLVNGYKKAPSDKQAQWLTAMAFGCVASYPDSAIKLSLRALRLAKYHGDVKHQILAYKALGEAHQYVSNFQRSISYYFTGIKLAEKSRNQALLGALYNGLGVDFYYMGDYTKSIHYMTRSAEIKRELGDESSYSMILTNLGGVLHSVGKHDSAMQVLRSAEKVLIKNNTVISLTSLYNSMGSIQQVGFRNMDSAAYYYTLSLDIAEKNNLTEHRATAHHNLGGVHKDVGSYADALGHLQRSLELARSIQRKSLILGVYRTFSETYQAMGNYKMAFVFKNLQLGLRDSIFKEEKDLSVQQMETQYRTAKKDEQIQRQKARIQSEIAASEKRNNRSNTILFIVVLLLVLAVSVSIYFWQRKRAEQNLEKEKSKIYQNIVHDIRTPLTLINGPLQNIKKKIKDAESEEDIRLIERNSGRLVYLVNELLDAAKLENKQFSITHQYGNPVAFITDVIETFRKEATDKKQTLKIHSTGKETLVDFPSNVLEKITANLVGNAIKYGQTGCAIDVKIMATSSSIEVEVSDNGPGIPVHEQPHVFNRFYRGQTHTHITGTGIGLAIVKELTEFAGGKIQLESKPNLGTKITVQVPIKQTQNKNGAVELGEDKPCILLVEDDADVTAFTKRILHETFTVITAANGKEGLRKCKEYVPDMVLTDVMMPEMDGIELITQIKNHEITRHIPTIIFSAKSSTESRLQGLQSGADGYLPKPFNPDELKLLVNNMLQTIQRNQREYEQGLSKEIPFKERLSGGNVYLAKIVEQIVAHIENPEYSVNELASDMCVSRSQLHRNIKSITGHSTTYLINRVRIEKAKDMLKAQAGNITEIAYACGFASQSYFTRTFSEIVGVPPSLYQK